MLLSVGSRTITRVVYQSCSTSRTASLPTYGWISSDGSSIPYTFSSMSSSLQSPTPSSTASASRSPGNSGTPSPTLSFTASASSTASAPSSLTTRIVIIGGDRVVATFPGGLSTVYTTGGTTQTVTETVVSAPTSVADASIGPCPQYDGRAYEDSTGLQILVVCGSNFNGTILSASANRLTKRDTAEDCTLQCSANEQCIGITFSEDQCTFYSAVSAQRQALVSTFSALRLENATVISNTTDTTTMDPSSVQIATILSTPPVSTQFVTFSAPASSYTYTTTFISTIEGTSASVSTQTVTTTASASLQISTLVITPDPITLRSTIYQPVTLPASTEVSIRTVTSLLPQATLTTTYETTFPASTLLVTTTLSGEVVVSTTTQLASTAYVTVTSLQAPETTTYRLTVPQTELVTLPASTELSIRTVTSILPQSTFITTESSIQLVTSVLPQSTLTTTYETTAYATLTTILPAETTTYPVTETVTLSVPQTVLQPTTVTTTELSISTLTSVLPASTFVSRTTHNEPPSTSNLLADHNL